MAEVDGSSFPEGYISPDGELEVRDGEFHETAMGQHMRWWRQAPDLAERYQNLLIKFDGLQRAMVKVRGHTAFQRPTGDHPIDTLALEALLTGLLASIERIADRALKEAEAE